MSKLSAFGIFAQGTGTFIVDSLGEDNDKVICLYATSKVPKHISYKNLVQLASYLRKHPYYAYRISVPVLRKNADSSVFAEVDSLIKWFVEPETSFDIASQLESARNLNQVIITLSNCVKVQHQAGFDLGIRKLL